MQLTRSVKFSIRLSLKASKRFRRKENKAVSGRAILELSTAINVVIRVTKQQVTRVIRLKAVKFTLTMRTEIRLLTRSKLRHIKSRIGPRKALAVPVILARCFSDSSRFVIC